MNKIGLQINRCYGGNSVLLTENSGDWTKKVVDARDILKLYNAGYEGKFAMFMSFSSDGTYITIARYLNSREGDHVAAWLFIPCNIEVDGTTLCAIINDVKRELSSANLDNKKFNQIFSTSYSEVEFAEYVPSSSNGKYAKRAIGFYSLKDVLGKKRYQSYYTDYAAILLEDDDTMKVSESVKNDLTQKELIGSFVLCPPVPSDIPQGVTVCNKQTQQPFNKPIRVQEGESVSLLFKRNGVVDIVYSVIVNENNQISGIPSRWDWKVKIDTSFFKVKSEYDNSDLTESAVIKVNGKDVRYSVEILEEDAKKANISVEVSGYEKYVEVKDLLGRNPLEIKLKKKMAKKSWKIETCSGEDAEILLETKDTSISSDKSPIEGYEYSKDEKKLIYTGALKQRFVGFLIACGIFLLYLMCSSIYGWYESHTFNWEFGWPPLKVENKNESKPDSPDNGVKNMSDEINNSTIGEDNTIIEHDSNKYSVENAIKYLDENKTWERDSLELYPVLQGLFDELNNYEFQKVIARGKDISSSKNYYRICKAISANKNKQFTPPYDKTNNPHTFTMENYINALSKPEPKEKEVSVKKTENTAEKKTQSSYTKPVSKASKNKAEKVENEKKKRGQVE